MNRVQAAFVSLICAAVFVGSNNAQTGSSAIGIVFQTRGQVFIQRGATRQGARLADLLYPGDKVIAEAGLAVFLFCPSSERITIEERTTVELSASNLRVVRGTPPLKTPVKCSLPRVSIGSESMERIGGLRPRGHPPISLYLGGAITSSRPIFHWGPIEGAQSFHLVLKNEKGVVIWETRTKVLSLAYPDNLSPLERSSYEWEVRAEANEKTIAQGIANFEVKQNPDLSKRPGADFEARLLRAIELENEGYYAEAAALFRELRDANAGDTRLTRHLAWLYWNAGLVAAVNEELKRMGSTTQ